MEVSQVLGDVDVAAESDMVVGHNDHTNEVIFFNGAGGRRRLTCFVAFASHSLPLLAGRCGVEVPGTGSRDREGQLQQLYQWSLWCTTVYFFFASR